MFLTFGKRIEIMVGGVVSASMLVNCIKIEKLTQGGPQVPGLERAAEANHCDLDCHRKSLFDEPLKHLDMTSRFRQCIENPLCRGRRMISTAR